MREVTQWFECDTNKPAHVGWYEARYSNSTSLVTMRWWDGEKWRLTDEREWSMFGMRGNEDKWRGLTESVAI